MSEPLVSPKKDQKENWNEIWERKSIKGKTIDFGRNFYNNFFLSKLGEHAKVEKFCELGCGSSTLLLRIAKFSKQVTGIDNSEKALERSRHLFSRNNITNSRFIIDDALNLKIKEEFDTVWSQGLIEHFEDPAKCIQQHLKITKKGGYTIISVPFKYGYMYPWYLSTRPEFLRRLWPWTEQIFFTKNMLITSLKKYCPEQTDYKIKQDWVLGIIILFIHKK